MNNYTREPPKEVSLPARLPLVAIPNQREGSANEDSRMINCYAEMGQDEVLRVSKRPGLTFKRTEGSTPIAYGAGMLGDIEIYQEFTELPIVQAKLYYKGAFIANLNSYTEGVGQPPRRFYSIHFVPYQQGGVYFIHDNYAAWTFSTAGILTRVPRLGFPVTKAATLNSTAVVAVADTSDLTVYSTVSGTGIPASTFIQSIDSSTNFTLSAPATITGASTLTFALGGPGVSPLALSTVPFLVFGVVDLNKSTYVFTVNSQIQGSDLFTPYAWNPLNSIYAYANLDQAVAITKQLSYIIVLKTESTEFFRDAGLSPGSPLERLEGMRMDVGCYAGRTVQVVDGDVLWASYTESGLKSVWKLTALKPEEIATPAIRRILESISPTYAISLSADGHSFYILTDPNAGISLVYDITSKLWSYWNALGKSYFPFVAATVQGSETLLQHESNNQIYKFDITSGLDDSATFSMEIIPPQYDAGMRIVKYLNRMYVVADQVTSGTLQVRVNDFDQDATKWTGWRDFNLAHPRPAIYSCASFTKRFFHFRYQGAERLRLSAVELDLLPGTL